MKSMLHIVLALGLASGFTALSVAQDGTKPADKHGHKSGDKHDHSHGGKKGAAKVGEAAPNFTLKTTDGKEWSLSDAKGKVVVLEWINPECPVCVRVMKDGVVANMIKACREQLPDVVFVTINSSAARPSSLEATESYLKEHKVEVPALLDSDGAVGLMYDAKTTPHCYVIDANGTLVYSGAIDDGDKGDGKMNYVVNAVTQLKAGEKVSPSTTRPYGCSVKYKK